MNLKSRGAAPALILSLGVGLLSLAGCASFDPHNKDGDTALIWACAHGRTERVKKLIAQGADVNARNKAGDTALLKSLQFEGCDPGGALLGELLTHGADVNAKGKGGKTPLSYCVNWGPHGSTEQKRRAAMVEKLVSMGADVDAKDDCGSSAIMLAVEVPFNEATFQVLFAHSADIKGMDCRGVDFVKAANKGLAEKAKLLGGELRQDPAQGQQKPRVSSQQGVNAGNYEPAVLGVLNALNAFGGAPVP